MNASNQFSHLDRHIRILLIDDFQELRAGMARALSAMGFANVTTLSDGAEALGWLGDGNQCDLIICDLNMPNMSGIELLHRIRKDPQLRSTAFLMITAASTRENVIAAAKAGVTDFIVKPFTIDQLLDKISALRGFTQMTALRNLSNPSS